MFWLVDFLFIAFLYSHMMASKMLLPTPPKPTPLCKGKSEFLSQLLEDCDAIGTPSNPRSKAQSTHVGARVMGFCDGKTESNEEDKIDYISSSPDLWDPSAISSHRKAQALLWTPENKIPQPMAPFKLPAMDSDKHRVILDTRNLITSLKLIQDKEIMFSEAIPSQKQSPGMKLEHIISSNQCSTSNSASEDSYAVDKNSKRFDNLIYGLIKNTYV